MLVHNECGNKLSKAINSKKAVLKEKLLPTKGKIRFVPPENWSAGESLKKMNGGFVDKFDNLWTKGPSRTAGEAFEWDVQLSKTGKNQLGWRVEMDHI